MRAREIKSYCLVCRALRIISDKLCAALLLRRGAKKDRFGDRPDICSGGPPMTSGARGRLVGTLFPSEKGALFYSAKRGRTGEWPIRRCLLFVLRKGVLFAACAANAMHALRASSCFPTLFVLLHKWAHFCFCKNCAVYAHLALLKNIRSSPRNLCILGTSRSVSPSWNCRRGTARQ